MDELEGAKLTANQNSDFEIQSQLTQIVLTYFAAIDDK
jgi:hypothetical protein